MSFFDIFKGKQKKWQDVRINNDAEPNLPSRRCSISKSGRLKARQIRKPLHGEFLMNKDNNNEDVNNRATMAVHTVTASKNKCDENEIRNKNINSNNNNARKISNHDVEEIINEEDVINDIYNVGCTRLETAL